MSDIGSGPGRILGTTIIREVIIIFINYNYYYSGASHKAQNTTVLIQRYNAVAVYLSEFEHIHGQIVTTPSCVYDRLFT